MLLFLAAPLAGLLHRASPSVAAALNSADSRQAIAISLKTTTVSLLLTVGLGTPLSVLLARCRFPGRAVLSALVEAPVVLPPAAAGIGLLLAFGRHGIVPTGLPFTAGAVVLAQVFVSSPFYIRPVAAALESLDAQWQDAAALDGATGLQTFRWIVFPLIRTSLISGAVMAWARSLGEFGATILFAGNLVGRTQTMPLAIYIGLESDLDQAIGLSVILLATAVFVLVLVRVVERLSSNQ